jgi:rare lipoprotein A
MTGETMKVSRMLPALVCGLALMGSAAGLQAGEAKVPPLRAVKPKAAAPAAPHQKGTIARATYYADRYHGRKTSSGEIYDSRKLTAAHPPPCGSAPR